VLEHSGEDRQPGAFLAWQSQGQHPRYQRHGFPEPADPEERAAQQAFDYQLRELGYRHDPMNAMPQKVLGMPEFKRRLEMRIGTRQLAETRDRWPRR